MMEQLIIMALLTLLAIVTIGIVKLKDLFGVVILAGVYSFVIATIFMLLDAPDVAMTEAAVGAGVSTVLFLGTLYLTGSRATGPLHTGTVALMMAVVTGGALIFGTMELPGFGLADAPIHQHVANRYLEQSIAETTVPNVVTSILASYRGFDTLGEVVVVFTAGIGVMMLLGGARRFGTQTADEASEALPEPVIAPEPRPGEAREVASKGASETEASAPSPSGGGRA